MKIPLIWIWIFSIYISRVQSGRILGLFVFPGKSHFAVFKPIMIELSKRGHEVTMVSNFRIDDQLVDLKQIIIEPPHDYFQDITNYFNIKTHFDMDKISARETYEMLHLIGLTTSEYALKNDRLQQIIHDTEQHYDLIIAEQFFQDALLIMGHKFQAPVVTISAFGYDNYMSNILGVISPYAHVPQKFLPYTDRMTFFQRMSNAYNSLYSEYIRKYRYFPKVDELIWKYFSHLPGPLPTVSDLERNISAVLLNSYVPLDISRPYAMNGIPVGGVHILPPKTVTRDIKSFLDNARNGAIYFSLGANVKSSDIPPEKLKIFHSVFGKLKESVLWKWEDDKDLKTPKNILIKKWVPQNDVLAHPHVKLFVTHGGLLSVQEAVFRSVPMLGIPIYGDQHLYIKRASEAGYAIKLNFENITETSLTWALQELLQNPVYYQQMRKTSQIFRDRPVGALETAVYWIEYVLRYKGAPHIKSAAIDLPWYTLYLFDILAFFILICLSFVGLICVLLWIMSYVKRKHQLEKLHKMN